MSLSGMTGNCVRRGAGVVAALAMLGSVAVEVATGAPAQAATNQFHGVNWADPRDNFLTDPNVPVGLSSSDNYASTYAKATAILQGFQTFGTNTVRFGINPQTTSSSWWNSLTGAYDAASTLGMNVMIAPWPASGGRISDLNAFYAMWDTVINEYGANSRFYFDLVNEPWGYSTTELTDLAATWLARYPSVARGRMVIPGSWADQNLCAEGGDSRLAGTLLSIHIYSMFGISHTTEAEWVTEFQNALCGYADRAVLTEFGVPMTTGVNYNAARDGNNNISYQYAITDTVRNLGMGSLLWTGVKQATQTVGPGPCDNASCAITSLNGTGTDLSLNITNQSGLDRLQWSWGTGTNPGGATSVRRATAPATATRQ
jgi:hypothetical protein